MKTRIVQNGHPILRKIAEAIALKDIQTPKIKKVISDMKEALHEQDDGVAIAAPQIGVSLRIFVIAGKAFDEEFISGTSKIEQSFEDKVCINPVFIKKSKDRKLLSEGCLSVRPLYGKVRRATRATIEAYDEKGKKFIIGGAGLLAHIFQHEIDHLDGILFIDKALDLHEVTEEEQKKYAKQKS